jgi:outer membrane immunogenic protein
MRRFLLAVVMCGIAAGAQAADLSELPILRGAFTEGLSSSSVNWNGFYAGGQVDYSTITSKVPGSLNSDLQATFVRPPTADYNWQPLGMARSNNTGYGAFAGYNFQFDDAVFSLEGNYIHNGFRSYTNAVGLRYLNDNVTLESLTNSTAIVRLSDFGSLRLRGGYAFGCFLPYVFAGIGVGSQEVDRSVSAFPYPLRSAMTTDNHSKLVYGYTFGGGIDMMLVGGLFARAEYEYRRVTTDIESNVNSVRLGLGYKF